jgi:hypothetical protein
MDVNRSELERTVLVLGDWGENRFEDFMVFGNRKPFDGLRGNNRRWRNKDPGIWGEVRGVGNGGWGGIEDFPSNYVRRHWRTLVGCVGEFEKEKE